MDENEEYFQRQASHRQSRRRFRKINQKGERQTIIDTVDPYPAGKPPTARGYHTVSLGCSRLPPSLPPPSLLLRGAALLLSSVLMWSFFFNKLLCTFCFFWLDTLKVSRSLSDLELLCFETLVVLVLLPFFLLCCHFYSIVLNCCCLFV